MEEAQRLQYLKRMGIEPYFPRFVLPGAKPSALRQPASPVTGEPQASTAPPETVAVATETGIRTETEAETGISPSPIPSHGPREPEPLPTGTSAEEDVRFRLGFIRVNDNVCALAHLPHAGPGQSLPKSQRVLFANLCRALRLDTSRLDFDPYPFRWPFAESGPIENSAGAARSALGAYLSQKFSERGFKVLLVMGTRLAPYLTPDDVSGGFMTVADHSCRVVYCRSLDEMEKNRSFKRDVWLELRRLALHDVR